MNRRWPPIRYDIAPVRREQISSVAGELASVVSARGYATLRSGLDEDALQSARSEAESLRIQGKLKPVPAEIASGLLGDVGSAKIAHLEDGGNQVFCEGAIPSCSDAREALRSLADAYCDAECALDEFGVGLQRGSLLLHETGFVEDPPQLAENDSLKWLETFTWQRIALILFCGPARGVFELKPFDEDADAVRVHNEPGMLLALRADQLWQRFDAPAGTIVLVSLLEPCCRKACGVGRLPARPPPAVALEQWLDDWIDELALDTNIFNATSTYMLDHTYHKSERYAVRGASTRCGGTWDPEAFWCSTLAGTDIITEIPSTRWDNHNYYQDDDTAWTRFKVNVRHSSFMDGIELFDNKLFRISAAETKGCDPMQRQILEVGYSTLVNAGQTQKSLLQSLTAVYVGCHASEFTMVDSGPAEAGGCEQRSAGTGVSGSIMSNRFSFIFGMMGPSVTIDAEAASSLAAVESGCIALSETRRNATMSSVIGINTILTPVTWFVRIGRGHMTKIGRCLSFDETANGWVKAECAGSLAIDNLADTVDGCAIQDDRFYLNALASVVTKHMGPSANLGMPSAAVLQSLLADACRIANISFNSVDAVECHGDGQRLVDAVEVASIARTLCVDGSRTPVFLSSVKTNYGNSLHATSMSQLLKVIYGQMYCAQSPLIHMNQLNRVVASTLYDDHEVQFLQESMLYPTSTSLVGVSAVGWGGTICSAICAGGLDPSRKCEVVENTVDPLVFWPGGGGERGVDGNEGGYWIVGSWDGWADPIKMCNERPGLYTHTVSLGANRVEDFHIWISGDCSKVLHPGAQGAPAGWGVHGPDKEAGGQYWRIDGRVWLSSKKSQPTGSDTIAEEAGSPDNSVEALVRADSHEEISHELYESTAAVGDKYKVHLEIAGKWKALSWYPLPDCANSVEAACAEDPSLEGTYQVVGDFNNWTFQEIVKTETDGCTRRTSFRLLSAGSRLQVVRNKDWAQVFHPDGPRAGVPGVILGPDSADQEASWWVDGQAGDTVEVEFLRNVREGRDEKTLCWRIVRHEPLTAEEVLRSTIGRYCVLGSWDRWRSPLEMEWDGNSFVASVPVCPSGHSRFVILYGGDWNRRLSPNVEEATRDTPHGLCWGSEGAGDDNCWFARSADAATDGLCQVTLAIGEQPRCEPLSVTW